MYFTIFSVFYDCMCAGLKGWDSTGTGVDINDELAQIANRADLGEEGPDGEWHFLPGSLSFILQSVVRGGGS